MNEKTDYGKMIAATLSVTTAVLVIAFVFYRLLCNLISFLAVYDEPEEGEAPLLFDEIDEKIVDDEGAEKGLAEDK